MMDINTQFIEAITRISEKSNLFEMAQEAVEQVVNLLDVDSCSLSNWDQINDTVTLLARHSKHEHPLIDRWFEPYALADYPLTRRVLEKHEVHQIRVDDSNANANEAALLNEFDGKSLLMLPLIVEGKAIGLFEIVDHTNLRDFTPEEIALVRVFLHPIAVNLERISLLEETTQHARELESLRSVGLKLTATLELHDILLAVVTGALQLAEDGLNAHIFLYQDGRLVYGAGVIEGAPSEKPFAEPRQDGLTYQVARSGSMVLVEDMATHPLMADSVKNSGWSGSIIALPIMIGHEVLGVMNVSYREPRKFNPHRVKILRLLADQVALAIENAKLHTLVKRQAMTDALTGLANRRAFDFRIREEFLRANRYQHPFTLLMVDLNQFKKINDTFGHAAGDEALQNISDCMQAVIRDTDFLARIGGDEFAIILPETEKTEAQRVIKKLLSMPQYCEFSFAESIELSVTIGLALFPTDADTISALMAKADAHLYEQKHDINE